MATVYAGTSGLNPAHTNPQLYSSCVWDYVIGWICQTNDTQVNTPSPPSYDPNPPTVDYPTPTPALAPAMASSQSNDCGCCGPSGGVGAPVSSSVVSAVAGMPNKCAGCNRCGYTNREALLAMLLAFGAFLLLKK